jgi:hypothetical protein
MTKDSVVQRLAITGALAAIALATAACAPDCDGLCNEGFDVCQRYIECGDNRPPSLEPPELDPGLLEVCLDYDDVAECVAECSDANDEAKEAAMEFIDFAKDELARVGC